MLCYEFKMLLLYRKASCTCMQFSLFRMPIAFTVCVCVRLFRHSNLGLITKGTIGSPVGKRPPVCQTCTKHMRGVAKMLEYKQKRNNGRTPFAGVYKFVCVCVCVCVWSNIMAHLIWKVKVKKLCCSCSNFNQSPQHRSTCILVILYLLEKNCYFCVKLDAVNI